MIQTITQIIDVIILITFLIVLFHTIRYYKIAYQNQSMIENKVLRSIVSIFVSMFHGISVIFGAPYIKDEK